MTQHYSSMPFSLNCGSLVVIILDAVSMLLYMCYWLHCIIGGGVGGVVYGRPISLSHTWEKQRQEIPSCSSSRVK